MAGQIDLSRDATTGLWTLKPKPGRNYGSPVVPESVRREAFAEVGNFHRYPWVGAGQVWQVTIEVINVRGEDNIDGLFQAFIADVSTVREFIFEWPQRIGGTGTDGSAGSVAVDAETNDNELTFTADVPPPSVGRLINFGNEPSKIYSVQYAPIGDQTNSYIVGINPSLIEDISMGTRINAFKPQTRAVLLNKPQLPTNESIVFATTLNIREQPPVSP